jgi:hypothetical protein
MGYGIQGQGQLTAQRVFAGLALGLLLGCLIGLSVSEVVASFIAAMAGLLTVILGVAPLPENGKLKVNHVQVASFALACVLSLLAAVYVRTHGLLSPRVSEQVADALEWKKIGLTPEHAAQIVTGSAPPALQSAASSSAKAVPGTKDTRQLAIASALSAAQLSAESCDLLRPDRLMDARSIIRTLRANGLDQLASRIEREPTKSQLSLYASAWTLSCE